MYYKTDNEYAQQEWDKKNTKRGENREIMATFFLFLLFFITLQQKLIRSFSSIIITTTITIF